MVLALEYFVLVVDAVWGRLGGMALLEKLCHLGGL